MRYVAAYLLATLGGKSNPSKEDVQRILESVGLDVDDEKLSKVISELEGKDIKEVINDGMGKLASMPSGGAIAATSSGTGGSTAATEAKEEAKEEKKEEEEEESDDDMGFGLFD